MTSPKIFIDLSPFEKQHRIYVSISNIDKYSLLAI